MTTKNGVALLLALLMLAPTLFADIGYYTAPHKLSGKLFEGYSGTYSFISTTGEKRYDIFFTATAMAVAAPGYEGPFTFATLDVAGPSGKETVSLGQGQSKTLKDGLVIFMNLITWTNENPVGTGSSATNRHRIEFTLVCDDKCQGIPTKTDDTYKNKEDYYKDCKYSCYQSCAAPVGGPLDEKQNVCVIECYGAQCAPLKSIPPVPPLPIPYKCSLDFDACMVMVKEGKVSEKECLEKLDSCAISAIKSIPYPPEDQYSCEDMRRECVQSGGSKEKCEAEFTRCPSYQRPVDAQPTCGETLNQCLKDAENYHVRCERGEIGQDIAVDQSSSSESLECANRMTLCIENGASQEACEIEYYACIKEEHATTTYNPKEICPNVLKAYQERCQFLHSICLKGGSYEQESSTGYECPQGCFADGEAKKCVPVGTRLTSAKGDPQYCNLDGSVYAQKEDGEPADNNYECRSNSARYGECEDVAEQVNILQKIFDWLSRFFS